MDNPLLLLVALMTFALIEVLFSAEVFKAVKKYNLREKACVVIMLGVLGGTVLGMAVFTENFFELTAEAATWLEVSEGRWLLDIGVFLAGMACIGGTGLGLFWMAMRFGSR